MTRSWLEKWREKAIDFFFKFCIDFQVHEVGLGVGLGLGMELGTIKVITIVQCDLNTMWWLLLPSHGNNNNDIDEWSFIFETNRNSASPAESSN